MAFFELGLGLCIINKQFLAIVYCNVLKIPKI